MNRKSFKQIEANWYELLNKTGFDDIEESQIPDRPLREWHSKRFQSETSIIRQAAHERYDECLDKLVNSEDFNEICELIVKHKNNSLNYFEAGCVIELHRQGLTNREIANRMGTTHTCVYFTLKKARSWMSLIA